MSENSRFKDFATPKPSTGHGNRGPPPKFAKQEYTDLKYQAFPLKKTFLNRNHLVNTAITSQDLSKTAKTRETSEKGQTGLFDSRNDKPTLSQTTTPYGSIIFRTKESMNQKIVGVAISSMPSSAERQRHEENVTLDEDLNNVIVESTSVGPRTISRATPVWKQKSYTTRQMAGKV